MLSVTTASIMCLYAQVNLDCQCAMKLPASFSDPAIYMQGVIHRPGAPLVRRQDGDDAGCKAVWVDR